MKSLTLSALTGTFAVCRLDPDAPIPNWAKGTFLSITRTADELSIVCPDINIPPKTKAERDWQIIIVHGPLDFSETGHLASLATPLAEAGISIFAISTYDTDYLLVKLDVLKRALDVLRNAGHDIN